MPSSSTGTTREGQQLDLVGVLRFATPTDRVLGWLRVGYRTTEYDFTGVQQGGLTTRGPLGELWVSYQFSSGFSMFLGAELRLEHWNNTRANYDFFLLDPVRERDVRFFQGEVGLIYWFEGRWGFRFAAGGGYSEAAPIFLDEDTARIRLGIGFTSRF
jgi:hypothetical protein